MAQQVVVRPSPLFRLVVGCCLAAGAIVGGLYAAMALMSQGAALLVPSVVVMLVLVGGPLVALRGRTVLTPDRVVAGRTAIPASQVVLVEVCRGLFTEWPVLHRWDGRPVALGAPVRLWFLPDPEYDRHLDRLRVHTGHPAVAVRHHWSVSRLVGSPLLALAAAALVLLDPPWQSDVWPMRTHARSLPDTCREFDARAHLLLPGARVDPAFSSNDSDDHHSCQWYATHLDRRGTRLVDMGRLSVDVELAHGIGALSDADEAHRTFVRESRIDRSEAETRLHGTGDEAYLITEHPGAGFTWVAVAVRRANVEEKIDLILDGAAREREAAADVTGLARRELADIRFRHVM